MTGFVTPLTREQPGKGRAAMLILEREGTGRKLKLKGWVFRRTDKVNYPTCLHSEIFLHH